MDVKGGLEGLDFHYTPLPPLPHFENPKDHPEVHPPFQQTSQPQVLPAKGRTDFLRIGCTYLVKALPLKTSVQVMHLA